MMELKRNNENSKKYAKKGMNVSDIIEITGLTKEEIEKLI